MDARIAHLLFDTKRAADHAIAAADVGVIRAAGGTRRIQQKFRRRSFTCVPRSGYAAQHVTIQVFFF